MSTYYWVGGNGNWSDAANHWSNSSGGSPNASYLPTSADNVIFDANSNTGTGAFTVTVDGTSASPSLCADFSTGGAGGALDGAMTLTMGATAQLNLYGSITCPATNLSVSATTGAEIQFLATTTGKTITSNGVSFGVTTFRFNGIGGAWTLGSALTCGAIFTNTGTLDSANYAITANGFQRTGNIGNSTLTLGSSAITLNGGTPINFTNTTGFTFNVNTSAMTCSGSSPTFNGGGLTFYNVTFSSAASGTTTINGANTFNNLTQTSRSATGLRLITLGDNQTVSGTLTFGAANTAIRRIFIRSSVLGTRRTITLNGTLATLTDVDFRDIGAAGSVATPWTGTRLGNCLNNNNITFDAPKTVYWNLAGTQNWSATGWATTNNGSPAANNFPLAQDTAVFTEAGSAGTVTMDLSWQVGSIQMADGVSNRTTAFTFTISAAPNIYGNVTLFSNLTITGTTSVFFVGQGTTQTITSAGVSWTTTLDAQIFGGTFKLADNLTNTGTSFTLTFGTVDLNNKVLTCVVFVSNNSNTRSIAFGTGNITVTGNNGNVCSMAIANNFSYTGTSNIIFNYSGSTGTRNIAFGSTSGSTESNTPNISITAGTDTVVLTASGVYRTIDFTGFAGTLTNNSRTQYGSLIISSGMTVGSGVGVTTFAATSGTQDITSNGKTLDFPITINASGATVRLQDALTMGSTRTLTLTNGTLNLNNQTLTTGLFTTASGTKNITFNGGTLAISGSGSTAFNNAQPTGFTTTTGNGTGSISMTSASAKTFVGGGSTYNCSLNQGGAGTLTITGANSFANITNTTQPATINFPANTTTTVTTLGIVGTAGNLVQLYSSTPGTQYTISDSSGITIVSYADIKDSNATGGAIFLASNSTNSGNNTGWTYGDLEDVSGAITSAGTVSSGAIRLRTSQGIVTSTGTASSDGIRLRAIYGDVVGSGNVDTDPEATFSAVGSVSGLGNVVAKAKYNVTVKGSVNGSGLVDATLYRMGEEWSDDPDESDTWTPVSPGSNTWTEQTSGSDTWQRVG